MKWIDSIRVVVTLLLSGLAAMALADAIMIPYRVNRVIKKRKKPQWFMRLRKWTIFEQSHQKMVRAGYEKESATLLYMFMISLLPVVSSCVALWVRWPDFKGGLLLLFGMPLLVEWNVGTATKRQNRDFEKSVYKVFKYLHHQTDAGILPTESMKSLHMVVDDPVLKKRLIRMAAVYIQTVDLDQALFVLQHAYGTRDVESLCIAIRQGIHTGDHVALLKHQERVMFQKYFHYIQEETNRLRQHTFFIVGLNCMLVVVLIGLPLWLEAMAAVQKIFHSGA